MTINIYPGQMPGKPIETHEWQGFLGDWFHAAGIQYETFDKQYVNVYLNGEFLPVSEWDITSITEQDEVSIRPVPFGFALPAWAIWAALGAVVVMTLLMRPKIPSVRSSDSSSGRKLDVAEGKANTAKLNQTVPELFGTFIRYPEYLVQPRRHFTAPREQLLEMLLCIGPGAYQIDPSTIKIGNTAISNLSGASYTIHHPGADLSTVTAAQNWFSSNEVGGTSAGTAGLDLTAVPDSATGPTASSYTFSGSSITASSDWPTSWSTWTAMSIAILQSVSVTRTGFVPDFQNNFTSDWTEIDPFVGLLLNAGGAITGTVRVSSVKGSTITLEKRNPETLDWEVIGGLSPGTYDISLTRIGRVYEVLGVSGANLTLGLQGGGAWAGFASGTFDASKVTFVMQAGTVYGELAGPFAACPASEVTQSIEVDIFFPQGLAYIQDDGKVSSRSVRVEIEYRTSGSTDPWQTLSRVYTAASMDQIGYTERINLPTAIRPEVRIRRRGAKSTSTQVYDTVQWYGLRALLPAPTSYPDWTTMSVSMLGLGQISASSENTVNLIATRILPTLQSNGTYASPAPTRDITAAVNYIITSLGESADTMDAAEFLSMHNLWTSRGEYFDAVFDETTAEAAIGVALQAGMAELTVDAGLLKPVREGIRTIHERSFSLQNTRDGINSSFTGVRPDDNDGVEIEFYDAADNYETATIDCLLPGAIGIKKEKIKLTGVTDKTRAWRIGMRAASAQRYNRWTYTFGTEMDGRACSYGSFIALNEDIPGWSQSALLKAYDGNTLTVNEPLEWIAGNTYMCSIRRPDGSLAGPYYATRGASDYELVIGAQEVPAISLQRELPIVVFGTTSEWSKDAIVVKIQPSGMHACSVTAKNYDPRNYAYDDETPT